MGEDRFTGTLPYASELFGIYQPLLGWRSKLTEARYQRHVLRGYDAVARRTLNSVASPVRVLVPENSGPLVPSRGIPFEISDLVPARLYWEGPRVASSVQSGLAQLVAEELGDGPPEDWRDLLSGTAVGDRLAELRRVYADGELLERHPGVRTYLYSFIAGVGDQRDAQHVVSGLFDKESRIAGYLAFLADNLPSTLTHLFFPARNGPASALVGRPTDQLRRRRVPGRPLPHRDHPSLPPVLLRVRLLPRPPGRPRVAEPWRHRRTGGGHDTQDARRTQLRVGDRIGAAQ